MTIVMDTKGYYFAVSKHPKSEYKEGKYLINGWDISFVSTQSHSLNVCPHVIMTMRKDDTKIEVNVGTRNHEEIMQIIDKHCS